jgi:TonB-linked SusC/RagA family outer membrane protein
MKKLITLRHIIVPLLCFLCLTVKLSGAEQQERITLSLKDVSITQIFKEIEKKVPYKFFYRDSQIGKMPSMTVNAENLTLAEILKTIFDKTNLTYEISGNQIVITQKEPEKRVINITGSVTDENKIPLAGVAVVITGTRKGVQTDNKGLFSIDVPSDNYTSLKFSMIGMNDVIYKLGNTTNLKIIMTENATTLSDVVVTGIVNKRAESFTGSATTISANELLRVGNKNVIESIKNIDPALFILDDFTNGSNPNSLPSMSLRGTSSFPLSTSGSELKGNYGNDPNSPLFILDGFETELERIIDMDMNRVESVTILKDASAKALYGSKAANGVVVIETKKLAGDKQYITYNGSMDIEMPDLTSYNLTNAAEKLEVERIEGLYSSPNSIDVQLALQALYNQRKKLIAEGLDTYWLSKPLRIGVGTKHNLSIELGDSKSLRSIIDFTYNNIDGVMKDSYRRTISGSVNLSYKYNNVIFRNIMEATNGFQNDSPWGLFSSYTKMNPYWRSNDPETGQILRWAEASTYIQNPMYDATIGTFINGSYLNFNNKFIVEYRPDQYFRITGKVGVDAKRSTNDEFYPANHSKYSSFAYLSGNNELKMRRGSYRYDSGKSSDLSADLNVAYTRNFGAHFLSFNVGSFISESQFAAYKIMAEGFPNAEQADITFARQYAEGSRPEGSSSINRELSFLGTLNYLYNNKYFADFTYRLSASSLYGKDNRWAPGWSAGIGWNLHNEGFLKDNGYITQLRLRASVGVTGNQNFNTSYAVGTYNYYTTNSYNGFTGSYLANLPNSALRWEQKKEYNIGMDLTAGRFRLKAEIYDAYTENMLTDVSVSPSTGFKMVKDNLGLVKNQGFEVTAGFNIWQNKDGFLNIFGSVASNINKILRLSESMKAFNALQEKEAADKGNNKPVLKYVDGMSMTAIWAVRSLGIDPMNGYEIYLKKDGTRTYNYDPLDLEVIGDSRPKASGNFGFTAEQKGLGISATFRYSIGGQLYNETLADRVENIDILYNVDKRVLLGRWQTPGQNASFKHLGTFQYEGDATAYQEMTRATSRFVQNRNDLTLGSASLYYEFPKSLTDKWRIDKMKLSLYMNDVFTLSTIRTERGLEYPFARTLSCKLSIIF